MRSCVSCSQGNFSDMASLYNACELEEHEDSDDTDDDVADAFQLSIHRNVVEDYCNDEKNEKWCDGTHRGRGEGRHESLKMETSWKSSSLQMPSKASWMVRLCGENARN